LAQSDNTNVVPLSKTATNSQKVNELFENKSTSKSDYAPAAEKMTQMINSDSSTYHGPRRNKESSLSSSSSSSQLSPSSSSSSQLRSTQQRIPLQNKNSQKTSINADETKDAVDGQSKAPRDPLIEQSKPLLPSSHSSTPSHLSASFPSSSPRADDIKEEDQAQGGSKRKAVLDTLDSKEKTRRRKKIHPTSPSREVHLQTSTREEAPQIDISQSENPLEHSKLHKAISSKRPVQREQTVVNMFPDFSITHLKQNPKIVRNDSELSVTINIGRIDVSAIISSPSTIKKLYNSYSTQQQLPHNIPPTSPPPPPLSLKDYLKQRASNRWS
jgi:hypothetical protein